MKYKFIELLCCVFAVLFIVYSLNSVKGTEKTAQEIVLSLKNSVSLDGLEERDNLFIKKTFGFSADDFESVVYYSSDDVMDVRELLVITFAPSGDPETVGKTVEEYEEERLNIFASYAPEQGEMLRNKLLEINSDSLVLYVGKEPAAVKDALATVL